MGEASGQGGRDETAGADTAALCKALGDAGRLLLIDAIASQPGICACQLSEMFEMSQSTLSHHMKVLCTAGLVVCEKRGKWSHYRLCADGIVRLERLAAQLRAAFEGAEG